MFNIFAHFELLLFDSNNIKHDCIEIIIVNFVNKIQKVRTNSKFNVKNSNIDKKNFDNAKHCFHRI